MAEKSPLVFIEGFFSQLPSGASVDGVSLGSLVAGSGLVGGGDLNTGSKRLDVGLAPSPSGIIFVGDTLGLDGADLAFAQTALTSGNAGLELGAVALASGVVAETEAYVALASGNSALISAVNFENLNSLLFTAASDIKAGYAVGLDDGGKIQSIRTLTDLDRRKFGSSVVYELAITAFPSAIYDSTNNRVVIAYSDAGNSFYGTAIVGTVSGTSISFGTAVVFESANTQYISSTYDSTNNRVVIAYRDIGNSSYGTSIVGTVSGTSISFGTPVVFENAGTDYISSTYDSTNNRVVVAYRDQGNSSYGTSIVGTVSGTSISFGTAVVFESAFTQYTSTTYDSTNNRVVIAYRDVGNSGYGTSIVGTVSGTSISFGTAVVFESASNAYNATTYDSTNNRVVIAYQDAGNSNYGTAIVGTVSGTSISFGTAVVFSSALSQFNSIIYDSTNNHVVIASQSGGSFAGISIVGTVSGTSISFGPTVVFESETNAYLSTVYDSTNDRVVIAYRDNTSFYGTAIVGAPYQYAAPLVSSQSNFIGVAQATVSSGTDVNVLIPSSIDFSQTTLTPGLFYYVDPTTSGFTTASGQPSAWDNGAYNWGPVGKAVSSSGLLLLNPM